MAAEEYSKQTMAAVTEHLVMEVAEEKPHLFIRNGKVDINSVLYYLGIDVDTRIVAEGKDRDGLWNVNNYSIQYDKMVRSIQFPRKSYKTTIYKGYIRNAVKVDENGKLQYDASGYPMKDKTKHHHLKELYDKFEVLQAKDILRYMKEEDMVDLCEVKWEKS